MPSILCTGSGAQATDLVPLFLGMIVFPSLVVLLCLGLEQQLRPTLSVSLTYSVLWCGWGFSAFSLGGPCEVCKAPRKVNRLMISGSGCLSVLLLPKTGTQAILQRSKKSVSIKKKMALCFICQ